MKGRLPSPSQVFTQQTKGGPPYRPSSSVESGKRQRPPPPPQRPQAPPRQQEDERQVNSADGEANPEPPIYGGVMGTPGVDFPAYTSIPKTNFRCSDVPYEPGICERVNV